MSAEPTPLWHDPRAQLPDADITVRVIGRNSPDARFSDYLEEFDAVFFGDDLWVDRANSHYETAEIVVWRDLTEAEANA